MDTQDFKKKKRKIGRNEQKINKAISKTNADDKLSISSEDEIDIHDTDIDYKANTSTPKQIKITTKKSSNHS